MEEVNIFTYPNPANNRISFNAEALEGEVLIEIYDMFGNKFHSEYLKVTKKNNVDIKHLSSGNYILVITSDKSIYTSLFTKL